MPLILFGLLSLFFTVHDDVWTRRRRRFHGDKKEMTHYLFRSLNFSHSVCVLYGTAQTGSRFRDTINQGSHIVRMKWRKRFVMGHRDGDWKCAIVWSVCAPSLFYDRWWRWRRRPSEDHVPDSCFGGNLFTSRFWPSKVHRKGQGFWRASLSSRMNKGHICLDCLWIIFPITHSLLICWRLAMVIVMALGINQFSLMISSFVCVFSVLGFFSFIMGFIDGNYSGNM